jgi:CheY-like chemotaxis protein
MSLPPATIQPRSTIGDRTILVVEDEVLTRLVIAEYLRECGYRVHEAANADEAVAVLETPEFIIDIVFSDVQMPGSMDGFGLAQWVRTNCPRVEVILTSGIARSAQLAGELCESGPLLAKPYDPALALDRIKQLLARAGRNGGHTASVRQPARLR